MTDSTPSAHGMAGDKLTEADKASVDAMHKKMYAIAEQAAATPERVIDASDGVTFDDVYLLCACIQSLSDYIKNANPACVGCREKFPDAEIAAHAATCAEHPMAKVVAELATERARINALRRLVCMNDPVEIREDDTMDISTDPPTLIGRWLINCAGENEGYFPTLEAALDREVHCLAESDAFMAMRRADEAVAAQ